MKKSNIVYLVLLIILTVLLVTSGYFYLNYKNKNTTTNITESENNSQTSGQTLSGPYFDIAKKIISWLDKQKNDANVYSIGCFCEDETCVKCQENSYAAREGILPVWGKFKYLEKTSDSEVSLSKDLDAILNSELQFDTYNCKFMFEMWQGTVLNNSDKEKVKGICRNSGYEALSTDYYGELNVEELDKIIGQKINQIIVGSKISFENDYDEKELSLFYRKSVTFVSEYATREEWEFLIDDEKSSEFITTFKKAARKQMAITLDGYSLITKNVYNNSLLGIAAVDMYKMTENKNYLTFAEFIYKETKDLDMSDINNNVYFALFLRDLFNATSNNDYQQKMKETIVSILNLGFDAQERTAIKDNYSSYRVPENGLMVGLLSL